MALCLILAPPVFSAPAEPEENALQPEEVQAIPPEVKKEQGAALGLDKVRDALPEAAEEYMGELSVTDALKPEGILERLRDRDRKSVV
jgi:hypothetical protein